MAQFKSKPTIILASAERVYDKLSNLEGLGNLLDKIPEEHIPEDKKAMFDGLEITADSITIPLGNGAPIGELKLRKEHCERPTLIRLVGVGTPVAMNLELHIDPIDDSNCEAEVVIDINIPALLKPMISGPLNKVVSQFSDVLASLPFD